MRAPAGRSLRRPRGQSLAAQLDQVVRNPAAYPIYGDAPEFFSLTYPTSGLKRLLARTFGRLSGAKVEGAEHGVIRAETSFGGGKTHSLMAVWHLATGARPEDLEDFVDPALLPASCRIAAVVADTLDPENGLITNGIRTHTLWGEIAAQLGPDAYRPGGDRRGRAAVLHQAGPGEVDAGAVGEQGQLVFEDVRRAVGHPDVQVPDRLHDPGLGD